MWLAYFRYFLASRTRGTSRHIGERLQANEGCLSNLIRAVEAAGTKVHLALFDYMGAPAFEPLTVRGASGVARFTRHIYRHSMLFTSVCCFCLFFSANFSRGEISH